MNSFTRILLFLSFILLVNGCKKDDDAPMDSSGQSGAKITTSFTGIVRDLQGNPMPGSQVSIGGKVVSTSRMWR
jgi:starvation-inducible outer membrane lipoprotein